MRRIGKVAFIWQDVVPAWIRLQALVLHGDLWMDRSCIQSIEDAGERATQVFFCIADGKVGSFCAAGTPPSFSKALGRDLSANDVSPAIENSSPPTTSCARAMGASRLPNPFVQQVWLPFRKDPN